MIKTQSLNIMFNNKPNIELPQLVSRNDSNPYAYKLSYIQGNLNLCDLSI